MPRGHNKVWFLLTALVLLCATVGRTQGLPVATGEWIPFTSETMEHYGHFTQRVTLVFKEMGLEPEYRFYPWRRCFDSVAKGRVWAAFPYSYTKERAEEVWFSDALTCSKSVFFYYQPGATPKHYTFNSLKDLQPYTIGGVTGYFYEASFQEAGLRVDYVSKEINALEKLKLGRIDLMPVNELVGWNLIQTLFPDEAHNFKTLAKPLNVSTLRLIVSKDYPGSKKLMDRFHQALERCIEKGLLAIEECR